MGVQYKGIGLLRLKGFSLCHYLVVSSLAVLSFGPLAQAMESKITPIATPIAAPVTTIGAIQIAQASASEEQNHNKQKYISLDGVKMFMSEYREPVSEIWPQDTFDCVGSIHSVLRFSASHHDLRNSDYRVKWINPQGSLELVSKHPSYYQEGHIAFRVASIVLKRPQGGGLFSLLDHSAGMERFIGAWKSEIWIAGNLVETLPFQVEC